jgi:hypothetical protein
MPKTPRRAPAPEPDPEPDETEELPMFEIPPLVDPPPDDDTVEDDDNPYGSTRATRSRIYSPEVKQWLSQL